MGIFDTLQEESTFSRASGNNYHYVVLQVVLKEKIYRHRLRQPDGIGERHQRAGRQGIPPAYDLHHQQRQQGLDGRRSHPGNYGIRKRGVMS